jgi:hypothetical protein
MPADFANMPVASASWPTGRSLDGGLDQVPLPIRNGALWLCGKHLVGPDPEHALARVQATTMVCLTQRHELADRYPNYVDWLGRHGGEHGRALWFPIPDLHAPPLAEVRKFLDGLVSRLGRDERIVMHCAAGIGRAGTLACCLLVLLGVEAAEARRIVAASRPMAGPEAGPQQHLVDQMAGSGADATVGAGGDRPTVGP